MENSISLAQLWKVLKNAWWKILIITLVAVLIAGAFAKLCVQKKYASSVEFYIVNVNQNIDYVQSTTLSANQQLAENYIEVIRSDALLSKVNERLKTNHEIEMSNAELRKMISSTTSTNASIFTITVTAPHPTMAYKITCYIAELAPDVVTEITKPGELSASVSLKTVANTLAEKALENQSEYAEAAEAVQEAVDKLAENNDALIVKGWQNRLTCIQVLRAPIENLKPVAPDLFEITLVVAAAMVVLSYAFFFFRDFLNTTIHSETDLKSLTDLPILGTIPRWEVPQKKSTSTSNASKGGNN